MPQITISDLEIFCRVGVPEEERATPQRLLVTVRMEQDFSAAAAADDIAKTIDYHAVVQRILKLGENASWRLIETLAWEIANTVFAEFGPQSVYVEVKKFIIPQARYVAVSLTKERATD